jgi:hypothetical protein
MKQVKNSFSVRFEKYFPSLRTYFDFQNVDKSEENSSGLIRNSRVLGIVLGLLVLSLMMFLYFFGTYQQEILKIDKALKDPFLEGKLTNPLFGINSFDKLQYCLKFFCSLKFTNLLKELGLDPIDHFHIWQFRVKSTGFSYNNC